jgi:hypothetical protein
MIDFSLKMGKLHSTLTHIISIQWPGSVKMGSLHKTTFVLLIFCLAVLGRAEYLKYKDPKQPIGARVNDLLGRMTLAEKIGQMTQIERENATTGVLSKYFIGKLQYFSLLNQIK